MSMKKNLCKLERVPLHEAWKHEANDFTPWLTEAKNLNTLADDLRLSELLLGALDSGAAAKQQFAKLSK
ncbi:hypothetical protein [Pseudomonas sp. G(2018)]|uniref:hypothetical protein n=1 Tax=Pseudomonas sp. G(2018) TaxID=2502242 RepID=UPI0010F80F40|nr:hypothetical protein [Pseudomonas sp. G(2018)]